MDSFRVLLLLVVTVGCSLSPCNGKLMKFVRLTDAPQTHGARCLDGSPPGFYFRAGFGSGRTKWIVHLQGGAFCFSETDCLSRAGGFLGSTDSYQLESSYREAGFLSDAKIFNPDFYNWNKAFVIYCDGGLFGGHREDPLVVNGTTLYFRGFRNLQAVMDALMTMGMRRATDVILTGCSAGGLATYIHADYVRSLLPPGVKYAAMADAGIFYENALGIPLETIIEAFNLHNGTEQLDKDCVEMFAPINEAWRCTFMEYAFPHITSPLFSYNSIHDAYTLAVAYNCFTPDCEDVDLEEALSEIGELFFNATADIRSREDVGVFFDSCLRHCQSVDDTWFRGVEVEGQSPRETFANWYFGREGGKTKVVDCREYPCNDSCGAPR